MKMEGAERTVIEFGGEGYEIVPYNESGSSVTR
jgi:hypothetical protein